MYDKKKKKKEKKEHPINDIAEKIFTLYETNTALERFLFYFSEWHWRDWLKHFSIWSEFGHIN